MNWRRISVSSRAANVIFLAAFKQNYRRPIGIDVSVASVCRYETAGQLPRRDVAKRILKLTQGQVRVEDFYQSATRRKKTKRKA